jgi:hypothetical protein
MYTYKAPSGKIKVMKMGVDAEITTRVKPASSVSQWWYKRVKRDCAYL